MKKSSWLILGVSLLIPVALSTVLFMRQPHWIYLAFGGFAALSAGYCFDRYMSIRREEAERRKGKKCRMCGKRKATMALTYGEDEGLCRECLDELLPLIDNLEMKGEK